jgi:tetratricopeptide (TPR) repeat protein
MKLVFPTMLFVRTVCIATAAFVISSCASSADVKQDNAAVKAAKSMERRAAQSFAAGEYNSAAANYESAALIYETLALPEPQTRARLSQARALTDAGQAPKAQEVVNTVLQNTNGLPKDLLVTAYGRAAALAIDNDVPRAVAHVQSAELACASTCAQLSAITVLRARTELAANNASSAVASANAALTSAQNNNDRANALRIRAQAQAALNQHAQVIADAQQALQLDQELGLAERVLIDLQLLQRASAAKGDTASAARYDTLAQRAAAATTTLGRPTLPRTVP